MEKLYNEITKNIKRYSNDFSDDMRKYIQNKQELHANIDAIDYYMNEISEAISKKNWFYIYDILQDNIFFEYINKEELHKMLMKYLDEHGADAFIENLRTNIINSSSTTSYIFILDFLWR